MNIFYNALLFYTRIRVPRSVVCNEKTLNSAFRYLPLVGLIVGGLATLVLYLSSMILPKEVAVILAMIMMLLITGAFHEDGLADFADGFGAGADKDTILRIMKDSHIGTYGVLTLIIAMILKYTLLVSIAYEALLLALVVGQGISRFLPVVMVTFSQYVKRDNAKASHSALGVNMPNFVIAMLFGVVPIFAFGWMIAVVYILLATIIFFLFKHYIERKIDGYTGDTLGALQQIAELIFYMVILTFQGL